jgi:hypothetical protein
MSPLEQTLYDLRDRAAADPFYADIPLFVMRPRVAEESFAIIQTRVDEAINCLRLKAGKGGAAVTFLMPQGDTDKPNVSGPQMRFTYTARVQEHPILNFGPKGTRKSAEEIALHTLQLFHLCMLNGANCLAADPATLTPSAEFAPKLTYDVRFFAQGNLRPPAKVALPLISPRSGAAPQEVTLTCATDGAALWYTLDGSYPSSANPEAEEYDEPFTVSTAATLRVAAEKTDLQQSDVAQAAYT